MKKHLFLLISLFITSHLLPAQVEYDKIDSLVQAYVANKHSHGIAVAIIDSATTKYFNYGHIDASKSAPVDENTLFEIGSCTKTFNGLLLSNAILEGKIDLKDKIDTYLSPEVTLKPKLKERITIIQLLTHYSGLPAYHNTKTFDSDPDYDSIHPYHHIDKEYAYNLLNNLEKLEPQEFVYSNFCYRLIRTHIRKSIW